jgi:hypothetical protein
MLGEDDARLQAARRRVTSLIQPTLETYGFRRKSDSFELDLSESAVGVLCLGIGAVDPIEVYVTVGVRFFEIEELASRLHGSPVPTDGWTVGARLCDLYPASGSRTSTVRLFGTDADHETVSQLLDDVRTYGVPFMREWSDLSRLIDYMKRFFENGDRQTAYVTDPATTLPVALALIGKAEDGLEIVRRTVASLADLKNRGYAYSYSRFAAAYEKLHA